MWPKISPVRGQWTDFLIGSKVGISKAVMSPASSASSLSILGRTSTRIGWGTLPDAPAGPVTDPEGAAPTPDSIPDGAEPDAEEEEPP